VADQAVDLLRGTLDLLILRALAWQSTHGYGVARWIEDVTDDALRIEEGSLYPALYRLERRAWIESEWGVSENNRKAKFYRLTRQGRAQMRAETDNFTRFVQAVYKALDAQPQAV
jgi:PadR family transcriptional regulator, regulatory protein PadR